MKFQNIKYILTDIEGTTTSVHFVYDVLFPYFRENSWKLKTMTELEEVKDAFRSAAQLSLKLENKRLKSTDEIIETLLRWSMEDRKVSPLKSLQGLIWKEGYEQGHILGHIYHEVPACLKKWKEQGCKMGVFSSGSVDAQKLIFGYSELGDLTPHFSNYFDTQTGGKRETETYQKITKEIDVLPEETLFLSDIIEELQAAHEAGLKTCQLVRSGTEKKWEITVENFEEIELI